jgi:hypothetical protein
MAIKSMLLVLSDLHFGRDLHLPPEHPPLRVTRAVRWLHRQREIERFIKRSCRGHSYARVSTLPSYLKRLIADARESRGFEGNNFELCILLGDQAATPDAQSYKFLREYLTSARYRNDVGAECDGLNFEPNQILAIPGNHDKLFRTNLGIYHQEFANPLDLPQFRTNRCILVSREISGLEFLFVLVDANIYADQDLIVDFSCRQHLARGEVTKDIRREIKTKLDSVKQGNAVDQALLIGTYAKAVKVLLVHYAVDIRKLPRNRQWAEMILPHECDGLDQMLSDYRTEFQFSLGLHGHIHIPALYNHDGVQVVSDSTATEQNGPNGFFILNVMDTGEILAEHHCWGTRSFTPDPDPELTRPLQVFPSGAAA